MSVTIITFALIGIKITTDDNMFGVTRRATCSHKFDVIKSRYCSKCGSQVEEIENKFPQFENSYSFVEEMSDELSEKFGKNWKVGSSYNNNYIVIGYGLNIDPTENEYMMCKYLSPDEIKLNLKEVLDPYGLYVDNENTFGLHLVAYYG